MVWDVARAACMRRARLKAGGQGTRGAHVEHVLHVRDAGRVEAQRLIERIRELPRVKRGVYGVGRGARYREAGGVGRRWRKRRAQGGPDSRLGARARAERTLNMLLMVVMCWRMVRFVCRADPLSGVAGVAGWSLCRSINMFLVAGVG